MEAVMKILKELSELLRTRFREMVMITMGFVIYKQQLINMQQQVEFKAMVEKDKQEQIAIFREVMFKQGDVLDKTSQTNIITQEMLQKVDSIMQKR